MLLSTYCQVHLSCLTEILNNFAQILPHTPSMRPTFVNLIAFLCYHIPAQSEYIFLACNAPQLWYCLFYLLFEIILVSRTKVIWWYNSALCYCPHIARSTYRGKRHLKLIFSHCQSILTGVAHVLFASSSNSV